MNFFDVLLHPDREELEIGERALVGMAANILQVGEFQVLQLAYMEWFGKDLPEALVFETGSNQWTQYDEWPPRQAQPTKFFFQKGGKLRTAFSQPMAPDQQLSQKKYE